MNTAHTAADASTTSTAETYTPQQAAAWREIIAMLAQIHRAEGSPPMSGDDALLMVSSGKWTIGEAIRARAIGYEIEQAMREQLAARPTSHAWHSVNGLELDLSIDGRLDISATDTGADGAIHLTARAALGLMMFFQFPGVAELITQANADEQARREADTQAEIKASRERDAELAAAREHNAAMAAARKTAAREAMAADPNYAAGLALGRMARQDEQTA